jgi:hypothetical protein
MRVRHWTLIAAVTLLALGGVALARSRASVSVRVLPAVAGAADHLSLNATLDGAVGGELRSYEIELARGFTFDSQGVMRLCRGRALRTDSCPSASGIGSGTGLIAVQGKYLPRTEYAVAVAVYLTPAQRRGDPAGVLLDLDEPQSSLDVALIGRVVRIPRGTYGLALRFSNTARELPSGFNLTLARLQAQLGSGVATGGRFHSLFTNPAACPRGGWPMAVVVDSGHRTRTFQASSGCFKRPSHVGRRH